MRIVVVASPYSGDLWLRCLLASLYDLDILADTPRPTRQNLPVFRDWLSNGGFPDRSILLLNGRYDPDLVSDLEALDAQIVTPIRHPYAQFAASFAAAQSSGAIGRPGERSRPRREAPLVGKAFDHPDVLTFVAQEIGTPLRRITEWHDSGQTAVVRYEDLEQDPAATLRLLTQPFAPLPIQRIERAVAACADSQGHTARPRRADRDTDVPPPTLTDAHLHALVRHTPIIRRLGYEPRFPSDHVGDTELVQSPVQTDELIPPIERMRFRYARKGGRGHFRSVSGAIVNQFVQYCDLQPDEHVLDVGSGVGRIALGLTDFLTRNARYEGFDVDAEGITWCQQNITPRYPNFRFQIADVANPVYHPEGSHLAS